MQTYVHYVSLCDVALPWLPIMSAPRRLCAFPCLALPGVALRCLALPCLALPYFACTFHSIQFITLRPVALHYPIVFCIAVSPDICWMLREFGVGSELHCLRANFDYDDDTDDQDDNDL